MQVWNVLHAAGWKSRTENSPKIGHLDTIAQLCLAISSQLRHVLTIGKKLLSSNISSTCPRNMELRPTRGWDRFVSLEHPCKFQRVSPLGSVTARHSSIGRQPNFAALNRGRHLYSTGRPSRWALAHILVHYCSVWNGRKSIWRQKTGRASNSACPLDTKSERAPLCQ